MLLLQLIPLKRHAVVVEAVMLLFCKCLDRLRVREEANRRHKVHRSHRVRDRFHMIAEGFNVYAEVHGQPNSLQGRQRRCQRCVAYVVHSHGIEFVIVLTMIVEICVEQIDRFPVGCDRKPDLIRDIFQAIFMVLQISSFEIG